MTLHWPATVANLTAVASLSASFDHLRITAVLAGDQIRVDVLMYPPGDPVARRQMREFLDAVSGLHAV
jgi:hypothetical protein